MNEMPSRRFLPVVAWWSLPFFIGCAAIAVWRLFQFPVGSWQWLLWAATSGVVLVVAGIRMIAARRARRERDGE